MATVAQYLDTDGNLEITKEQLDKLASDNAISLSNVRYIRIRFVNIPKSSANTTASLKVVVEGTTERIRR